MSVGVDGATVTPVALRHEIFANALKYGSSLVDDRLVDHPAIQLNDAPTAR
jgi:hypothetical protein